jgi:glycosyltransferase involved in cell wall biosynthesis
MQTKRIAIVSHVNPFSKGSGQVERVYNTLLALASEWNEITLYTLNKNQSSPKKTENLKVINSGVKIIYLKNKKPNLLLAFLFKLLPYLGYGKDSNFSIPFLFKGIEKELENNYDVVLFEYWHLHKMAYRLKEKGLFVICDTHNILLNSYKQFIKAKNWLPNFYKTFLINKYKKLEFEVALKNSFNLLIAINKEEEAIFKKRYPKQLIYYFPMGITLTPFLVKEKENKKELTILYYGGLGSERNYKAAVRVIEAFNLVQGINVTLKIIGSNPPLFLKEIVDSNENVILLGFVEDISLEFKNVDLAVIPFEGKYGFRSRLIELMHFGVPVLTTNDAVWGMGFEHNLNIIIYKDNLPFAIESSLNDCNLRNIVALNAKKKVEEEFTFESTYQKFAFDLHKIIEN